MNEEIKWIRAGCDQLPAIYSLEITPAFDMNLNRQSSISFSALSFRF